MYSLILAREQGAVEIWKRCEIERGVTRKRSTTAAQNCRGRRNSPHRGNVQRTKGSGRSRTLDVPQMKRCLYNPSVFCYAKSTSLVRGRQTVRHKCRTLRVVNKRGCCNRRGRVLRPEKLVLMHGGSSSRRPLRMWQKRCI